MAFRYLTNATLSCSISLSIASLTALARASSRSRRDLSWGVSPLGGRKPDMNGFSVATTEDMGGGARRSLEMRSRKETGRG